MSKAQDYIQVAHSVLIHGEKDLFGTFPGVFRAILKEKLYKQVLNRKRKPFKNFYEFAYAPLPEGLAINDRTDGLIQKILEEDTDTLILYCKELKKESGGQIGNKNQIGGNGKEDTSVNNVNARKEPKRPMGNTKSYALTKLHDQYPELYQRVKEGELSANAAAIQAGFRTKPIYIPNDPEKAAETIKRRCSKEFVASLKALL